MATEFELRALADRYCDSLEQADISAFRGCYAPDAKIWQNVDEQDQTLDGHVAKTQAFLNALSNRAVVERRIHVFHEGFVHQHELRGARADGAALRLRMCIVCNVKDGLITRRDEYFDSGRVAAFMTS